MMTKRFNHYYLQWNVDGGWTTLGESDTPDAVVEQLFEQLQDRTPSELRIVGAEFDETSSEWSSRQLFYVDTGGIALAPADGIGVEREPPPDADPADEAGERTAAAPDGPDIDRPPLSAADAVSRDPGFSGRRDAPPWSPDREDAPVRLPAASPKDAAGSSPLFYGLVAVIAVVLIALGSLLYAKHPIMIKTIDALGLDSYIRLAAEHVPPQPAEPPEPAATDSPPFASGAVTRHDGVAAVLLGRWSPEDCRNAYIEFSRHGYRRATAAGPSQDTRVIETLRDEFTLHLRLSPNIVEHFRMITENDIAHAGTTTARGYHANAGRPEIYSRCR